MFGIDSYQPETVNRPEYGSCSVAAGYIARWDGGYEWTKADTKKSVAHLFVPIATPPQSWPWPLSVEEVLKRTIQRAKDWGLPEYCPLILDVEQQTTETQFGANIGLLIGYWQNLCRQAGYLEGFYGSEVLMLRIGNTSLRWIAQWPIPTPSTLPTLPQNYYGHQFAGNQSNGAGGTVDLNVFDDNGVYLDTTIWASNKKPTIGGTVHAVGFDVSPQGGYYLVETNGKITAYGGASHYGDASKERLSKPIIGIRTTVSGKGYYLYAQDGGIFSYGDAHFYGSGV